MGSFIGVSRALLQIVVTVTVFSQFATEFIQHKAQGITPSHKNTTYASNDKLRKLYWFYGTLR